LHSAPCGSRLPCGAQERQSKRCRTKCRPRCLQNGRPRVACQ
jgi:hypothetical protein